MGRFSYLEQKNQVTKILRQKKRRKGVADQMRTEVRNKPAGAAVTHGGSEHVYAVIMYIT